MRAHGSNQKSAAARPITPLEHAYTHIYQVFGPYWTRAEIRSFCWNSAWRSHLWSHVVRSRRQVSDFSFVLIFIFNFFVAWLIFVVLDVLYRYGWNSHRFFLLVRIVLDNEQLVRAMTCIVISCVCGCTCNASVVVCFLRIDTGGESRHVARDTRLGRTSQRHSTTTTTCSLSCALINLSWRAFSGSMPTVCWRCSQLPTTVIVAVTRLRSCK